MAHPKRRPAHKILAQCQLESSLSNTSDASTTTPAAPESPENLAANSLNAAPGARSKGGLLKVLRHVVRHRRGRRQHHCRGYCPLARRHRAVAAQHLSLLWRLDRRWTLRARRRIFPGRTRRRDSSQRRPVQFLPARYRRLRRLHRRLERLAVHVRHRRGRRDRHRGVQRRPCSRRSQDTCNPSPCSVIVAFFFYSGGESSGDGARNSSLPRSKPSRSSS